MSNCIHSPHIHNPDPATVIFVYNEEERSAPEEETVLACRIFGRVWHRARSCVSRKMMPPAHSTQRNIRITYVPYILKLEYKVTTHIVHKARGLKLR
jgi:hypothetical protein